MKIVCNLEEFFFTQLEIIALTCDPEAKSHAARVSFDYDLATAVKDDHRIRMEMSFSLNADGEEEPSRCPYAIEAKMVGFFAFPQDLEDKQIAYLCRVNTLTILYGILRGQIASMTGSFPHGKFILPTVMMPDIVTDIEEKKQQAEEEQK
jgi:preprotein translocase subunit SecB